MALTQKMRDEVMRDEIPFETEPSFTVMHEVVVATIKYVDGKRGLNAHEAALLAIAKHGRDGTYRFPGPHADIDCVVTVTGVDMP